MSRADELKARILGPLNDASPMPFGIHKGENMASVPAGYLLWCYEQEWIKNHPKVAAYIEKCKKTLKAQAKDEEDVITENWDCWDDPRSGQFGRLDE